MNRAFSVQAMVDRRRVIAGLGAAAGALAVRPAMGADFSRVEIASGRLGGYFSAGVHVFKGVPYASAAGRRFQAPVAAQPWRGVRDARHWGPPSPQFLPPPRGEVAIMEQVREAPQPPAREDCLVLNIWTPALGDGGKRPVMVWLHGGGYSVGSGSSERFDGTRLAQKGDAVVVTVNHRLNLFGYLCLAGVRGGGAYPDAGNAGMLDIVAALRWIRDNIVAFGGDPGNVTIFGQSGGGGKVSTLLGMPAAAGLFHRAIIQSGPGVRAIPVEEAGEVTRAVMSHLGLADASVDSLLRLPTDALVRALATAPMPLRFGAVVDGRNVPRHPFDPVAPTGSADVPILIGTNGQEVTSFLGGGDPGMFALREDDLDGRLRPLLGADTTAAIAAYRAQLPQATPSDLYATLLSDLTMRRHSIELAERKAAQGRAPVFMYWFTKPTPVFGGKYGAPHGIEIPYVFDNVDVAKAQTGSDDSRYALAETCSAAWLAFARTGDPRTSALPDWRPYRAEDRATMILDDRCRLAVDPLPAVHTAFTRQPPWKF